MFLCGSMAPRQELIDTPYLILVNNSLFGLGWLVTAGVFLATISSAIGSDLGAPRVLQALARDRVLKVINPFGKGTLKGNEPRRALVLTFLIGIGMLLVFARGEAGEGLNVVASVVSMIFLYTYGMTNLAAFVEHFGMNPSFRPRFRFFHWWTALLGGLSCIWVAFMINAGAAFLTLCFITGIFMAVRKRKLKEAFGDAGRGFVYTSLSRALKRLVTMPTHPKNWRPTILVLTGNPLLRSALVQYASWLGLRSGIITLMNVVQGEEQEEREDSEAEIRSMLEGARIEADILVPVSKEPFAEQFRRQSSDASLIILGLNRVAESVQEAYFVNTEALLEEMPTTLLVHSSGEADLLS